MFMASLMTNETEGAIPETSEGLASNNLSSSSFECN